MKWYTKKGKTLEFNKDYEISEATLEDIMQIVLIHNDLLTPNSMQEGVSTEGFLPERLTYSQVIDNMKNGYTYLVAKRTDQTQEIMGYVYLIDISSEILEFFALHKMKTSLQNEEIERGKHIDILAIKKKYHRKGIGTQLYQYIKEQYISPISAFIAVKPQLNQASIRFHQEQGFKKIGEVKLSDDPIIEGYDFQSDLYVYEK